MSFYMDGQRFKSRPRPQAQPPQFQPSADEPDMHPLRQHSISQDNSPTLPAKQPTTSNPTSYSARATGKPPLSVDTSPRQRAPQSHASARRAQTMDNYDEDLSPSVGRRRPRSDSVPDRSPLQNLEVSLGDMSKEEKRARVEEAERNLKSRRDGDSTPRAIPRKPVGRVNGGQLGGSQRSRQSNGNTDYSPRSSVSRGQRKSSLGLDPFPSRDRQYGYDASRTGGAAAAAVGAYQLARRPYHQSSTMSPTDQPSSYDEPADEQYSPEEPQSTQPRVLQGHPEAASTGNRNVAAMPKAQKLLGADRMGSQAGAKAAKQHQEPDPLPRDEVRNTEPGMNYNVPPQTAAARDAREAVGMDDEHADREETGGRGGRLKFSQVIHPYTDGTGRKYKEGQYLEDWRNAATGTLTAADMDPDASEDQSTWWEREKGSGRGRRGRSSAGSAGFAAGAQEDGTGRTAFNPPLSLKCGPLLRYIGMRGDQGGSQQQGGRTFWRGTVMIVTEDATSSTEAAPTLRLFAQPTELYQPSPKSGNQSAADTESRQSIQDPITGQSKCGPNGQTLFVKHVSQLTPETDLSLVEGDRGLFTSQPDQSSSQIRRSKPDGEKLGRFKDVRGHRLHHERGWTFWRFNIEVELGAAEARVAYRINGGPAMGFWVPAKNQPMNIMFHSCNGFSLSVDPNKFSGPDPLWRDVLNDHQQRPLHVMIGGGDQIYNDAATRDTHHFEEWLSMNHEHKYTAPFSEVLQDELEMFYLHRYAMWFSQGLFGMANSQIPMVNIWDDHDIIDGYGSYPHHFMSCPVFTGLGAVAFKYYMLFQHQSVPSEDQQAEPSWILGPSRGPYINQHSRSVYMSLGHEVGLIGVDCRTERMKDEVLSHQTYEVILDRLDHEVKKGEVKHLIVLLGIPIAYPRMTFAENILTSRAMDPIKALARTGIMGGVLNKFDGGVEVLDDLDDHWTAKHHKTERNWLIQDLQDLAAAKSCRITILGGDVHLAAVGQFYSKKKMAIPKDHDHRYIPNIISSAIVNTPPPEAMADFLNKRNKVHHLDDTTDEDMIPLFTYDVDGRDRNNHHLLPRRNYCVIRPYQGDIEESPPASVYDFDEPPPKRPRSFSLTRRNSASSHNGEKRPGIFRRLSNRVAPPSSYKGPNDSYQDGQEPCGAGTIDPRVDGASSNASSQPASAQGSSTAVGSERPGQLSRSNSFLRRPNVGGNQKAWAKDPSGRQGHIDLTGGLEVVIRCEINQKDPSGKTQPYRMLIPALDYQSSAAHHQTRPKRSSGIGSLFGSIRRNKQQQQHQQSVEGMPYETNEPATPAMMGDQRYTTMMENQEKEALGNASTKQTDRTGAARALDGDSPNDEYHPGPQRHLKERATLDSLPRSGVVETDWPNDVPRQPYQEQRRGSSDQQRGHAGVGRSRSQTDRSNSQKYPQSDQAPQSAEERAYWGAQQVRGEGPKVPQEKRQSEKGLRRYYANPFGSTKKPDQTSEPSNGIPTDGLEPPLGRVNNRIDSLPTKMPDRSVSDAQGRRVASDSSHQPTQAGVSRNVSAPTRSAGRPAEKDPYAHYMPEAVEAEFASDEDVSDLDDAMQPQDSRRHGATSEVSSPDTPRRQSRANTSQPNRDSFVSANTNTSLAQNRAQDDSPLYSDEDDLDGTAHSRMTPSPRPPTKSPERRRRSNPQTQSRPLSKIERLTGASDAGQRESCASGNGFGEEEMLGARPVGQGSSGKATKMLGPEAEAGMNGYEAYDPEMGRSQSGKTGGRFGGLMRRLSERGDKTRRRLSSNGGVR